MLLAVNVSAAGARHAKSSAKSTLVVLEEDVAPTLDYDGPNASLIQTQEIQENLMDPLVNYPQKLKGKMWIPNYNISQTQFASGLATSYTKKGNVFTFHLRKGVTSCAGNPLTADDVVYTFARAKSLSGAAPIGWFLGNVGGIFDNSATKPGATAADKQLTGEVTKIDKYTVQIKQLSNSELFPRTLTVFGSLIFDAKDMQAHATASDPWSHNYTLNENTPGFGAYCLSSWTKGSQMVLQANSKYYLGQPQFKTVIIRAVPSISSRLAALTSGAADVVYPLFPDSVQFLKKQSKAEVISWQNNYVFGLTISYNFAPFNLATNALIRQAIAYAIPYNDIIKLDYGGAASRWWGITPSPYYGFKAIKTYNTNLVKAKQLLTQAGFPNGDGLDKYSSALTLYYATERSAVLEPVANRIQTALAKIGMHITLSPIDAASMASRTLTKGDIPMYIRDNVTPVGTDTGFAVGAGYVKPSAGGVAAANSYTGVDAAYNLQKGLAGAQRLKLLNLMQQKMMHDLPVVPILEYPTWFGVRKGITNIQGRPTNALTFWWLKCPTC